jgi:type II secretory pathway pseudopilin PulG
MHSKKVQNNKGIVLSGVLVFALIAVALITALTSWFGVTIKSVRTLVEKEQAFHIAEAGIEYYRWHLAHAPEDFQDGTGEEGPYIHDVEDKDGNIIGNFSLEIEAPQNGTTLVTVTSTGTVIDNPGVSRVVRAEFAKPSFAKYAFVADANMRFGEGTEVFGPIHSNGGIRFDGLAHNLISSAKEYYDDPDHSGPNEFGVHTHLSPIDPYPPTAVPDRFDVFEAGRLFPVPAVDFDGLTTDVAALKDKAQEPEGLYFSNSGRQGWHVVLKTDDTFDLYKVRRVEKPPDSSCTSSDNDWGTWSIDRQRFEGNFDFPENGIMFFEDHVWVDGQIDTARLTIVAGTFPDIPQNRKNIIVNTNLLYTNYDGQDVISLIAQHDINIGLFSDDNFQIDAALIAQNGRVGRHYYEAPYYYRFWYVPGCSPYHERDTVSLYGMIGTNERYGFAYTDGTGYETRNITYDANLLYGPPPEFPLTADSYEPISWEEVVD